LRGNLLGLEIGGGAGFNFYDPIRFVMFLTGNELFPGLSRLGRCAEIGVFSQFDTSGYGG
jgi:hypothetical protein